MAVSRSWTRCAAVAAAALLGAAAPGTAPAHAGSSTAVQCKGTESVTYRPGVTFAPRNVEITTEGRFTTCADSAGEVTSGAYGERFTVFAGCNDLLGDFKDRRTVKWSTGESSVIDATGNSTAVAGQVITTITGTVEKGRYQGRSVVQTVTLPQPDLLQCLSTGLTGATGVTTLSIG
ncbi:hypothetical protein ABZ951_03845 [Streptomyces sp. NPDC046215]|uniref:hypothetical protein n=1 Tax=Streptomyces TaxID=1883 RepID=UPI0031CF52B6